MTCTSFRCLRYNHNCNKCFGLSVGMVYDELWRGRDFEISHLWQRSVFLAVFMIAIAGAYGTVLMKVVFPDKPTSTEKEFCCIENADTNSENTNDDDKPIATKSQQQVLISLTCLGSIFSMLWCMMSKGSKYWTERYEAGISYFTDGDYAKELKGFDKTIPLHGSLPSVESGKLSDNILSPLAGRYSVSKVNITIGIVSLFAWGILCSYHLISYSKTVLKIQDLYHCVTFGILFCTTFNIISFVILKMLCRSGDEN